MKRTLDLQTTLKAALILWFVVAMVLQHDVGLADNGDFTRSMSWISSGPLGIEPNWPEPDSEDWGKRFNNYWIPFWKLDWSVVRPTTSAFLLWLPGAILNCLVYSRVVLYIPILAFFPKLILFAILLLIFHWVDLYPRYTTVLLFGIGVPAVLIFTNTEYMAYFNTFYLESASFVFLFLLLAFILLVKQDSSFKYLLCSLVSILLLTTAKPANFYWPILAVPFVFYAWSLKKTIQTRTWILVSLLLIPLFIGVSAFVTVVGSNQVNPYNSLFVGVLRFSRDPSARLQELGMDGATECLGNTAFTPVGASCLARYQSQISYKNTILVLSREPLVLFRMLKFAFDHMQDVSVDYLGKYSFDDPRSKTFPPIVTAEQRFWPPVTESLWLNLWAKWKFDVFPTGYALGFVLICFLLWFLWQIRNKGIQQDLALIGLLCTVACLVDTTIVIVGDGIVELVRHLFLSNLLFDIALLAFLNSLLLIGRDHGLPAFESRVPSLSRKISHPS